MCPSDIAVIALSLFWCKFRVIRFQYAEHSSRAQRDAQRRGPRTNITWDYTILNPIHIGSRECLRTFKITFDWLTSSICVWQRLHKATVILFWFGLSPPRKNHLVFWHLWQLACLTLPFSGPTFPILAHTFFISTVLLRPVSILAAEEWGIHKEMNPSLSASTLWLSSTFLDPNSGLNTNLNILHWHVILGLCLFYAWVLVKQIP